MQTVGRCGGSVVIHDLWLDRHQDLPECPAQKNGDKWQLVGAVASSVKTFV